MEIDETILLELHPSAWKEVRCSTFPFLALIVKLKYEFNAINCQVESDGVVECEIKREKRGND